LGLRVFVTESSSSIIHQITTHSVEETKTLGKTIGETVTSGIVLALTGDLGSGKTSFVQGLAKGLEVPDEYYITSPSYTLINEYPGRFPLFHVDLYRISNPVDVEDIGLDEILNDHGIVAIEWADRMEPVWLSDHIDIQFEIMGDKTRKISIIPKGFKAEGCVKKIEKLL
jgi:tRNA threonylcarbamoyladenosine biosynthesis protein TsaE